MIDLIIIAIIIMIAIVKKTDKASNPEIREMHQKKIEMQDKLLEMQEKLLLEMQEKIEMQEKLLEMQGKTIEMQKIYRREADIRDLVERSPNRHPMIEL